MRTSVILLLACTLAVPLSAHAGRAVDAAIGGALGGATGAVVGNAIGGRSGAIVGGALGAGVGAAIATQPERRRHLRAYRHRHYDERRYHDGR